jgi:TP901 family phage tail tape measure protein
VAKPISVQIVGDYNDKDVKRAMRDLERLQSQTTGMGAKMAAVGTQMQNVGAKMAAVGKGLTLGLTLPIVGIGIAATKMATDFDTSMTKMISLVGLTREEVDGMRTGIVKMAGQYGKSAQEAADAMFFITSAGLRGSDAMETLEASLKGAAVGLGDVQTIADLATSAMNAYGPETLSAGLATDVLAAAVREGKLEASELAGAMGGVLPIASALGVGFDEVGAAMASMSRTGTNAAEASTQVRGILAQIAKETPKGVKALKDVGLTYDGLRESLREKGLLATLQTLKERFGGNTVATSAFFGNVRALTGVMDMLGTGAETTTEIFGRMSDSAGMLDEGFAAVSETTGFKLSKSIESLKNSLISFGDIIAPFVAQFAEKISTIATAFQNLAPETKNMIVMAAAVAAALGPVLLVAGKLIGVVGGLMKVFAAITIAGSILAIKVIAVVAVLAAIALAFKWAYENSQPLRTAVDRLIDTFKGVFNIVKNSVLGAFDSMNGAVGKSNTAFTLIGNYLKAFFTGYVTYLTGIIAGLGAAFQVAMKIFEIGFTVLKMGANIIKGVLLVAFDILMNRLGPISTAFRGVANGVKSAFGAIAGFVRSAFNNAGKIIEGFINKAIGAVNILIRAFNLLAKFLPGVSEATEIAEFRFNELSGAVEGVGKGAALAATAVDGWSTSAGKANLATKNTAIVADVAANSLDGLGAATTGAGAANEKASEKTKKFQDELKRLTDALKDSIQKAKDYASGISDSFVGMLSLSDAFDTFTERQTKVTETLAALTKFQAEIQGEATEDQKASLLSLQKAYQDASADAANGAQSVVDEFINQGKKLSEFTANVNLLLSKGLSRQAFETIIAAGAERGADIADALAQGNIQANVDNVNAVYTSVAAMGQQVGNQASSNFMMQGVVLAQSMLVGLIKEFMPAGKKRRELLAAINGMVSEAVGSMAAITNVPAPSFAPSGGGFTAPTGPSQSFTISDAEAALVLSNLQAVVPGGFDPFAGIPFFANGGIVTSPTLGMIGEAGPEAIIPLNKGGGIGSTTINLTVNAGMGTDGGAVGEQIVSALRQYQRRNGAVPIKVA